MSLGQFQELDLLEESRLFLPYHGFLLSVIMASLIVLFSKPKHHQSLPCVTEEPVTLLHTFTLEPLFVQPLRVKSL